MISAAAWIAKGKAARHPTKYAVDDAELERVAKLANVQFEDAKAQLQRALVEKTGEGDDEEWQDDADGEKDEEDDGGDDDDDEKMEEDAAAGDDPSDPDGLKKYNLDDYDTEERVQNGPFTNVKGLQYYRNNDEDPYITLKEEEQDEEEEREDLEVQRGDNLIVCAKTEDEVSLLEAYLYSPSDANLYVHHDLMLPSFPLCLEWLDYKPFSASSDEQKGNFIAVGTMDPEIEIWSMDVVEGLYPDALLGQRKDGGLPVEVKGTGKKKRKQRIVNAEHHVDAVLSLSWNHVARNLLASASADKTIKLWDLAAPEKAIRSFDSIHQDKVQSVSWDTSGSALGSVAQAARMLSGSYDKSVAIFDSRSPSDVVRAQITADVEAVRWNPWREHNFLVALEDGLILSKDARMPSKSIYSLSAHDGGCTSLDFSPHIPGCLLTGGTDKLVKLWSIVDQQDGGGGGEGTAISMVASRNLDAGKIFTAQFSPDDPLTLIAAGSQGSVRVWDALANVGVRKTFGDRLRAMPSGEALALDGSEPARGDGVIRVADEDDEDEDDKEGGGGDNDAMMA